MAPVRILHPASTAAGPLHWSEIAEASETIVHPLVQLHLTVPDPDDGPWKIPLEQARPPSEILSALVSRLGPFTTTSDH